MSVEGHGDANRFGGDLGDVADVAVEDVLLVIVAELDDFVAGAEIGSETLDLGGELVGRIEAVLEIPVERGGAKRAAVHRGEHLDVLDRIEAEAVRDTVADKIDDGAGGVIGGGALEEIEVGLLPGRRGGGFGQAPGIDGVGGGDDPALGGLAEDLGQAHDGHGTRLDDIGQDRTRSDGGELIDVADDEEVRLLRQRLEEGVHERHVDHRGLVENEEATVAEPPIGIAGETFGRLVLEEPVQRLRLMPR